MALNRRTTLAWVLAAAALTSGGAWWLGARIESPAEAAARTAPPPPSPILVPVEQRVLSSTIVTRGTGRFGTPQKLSIAPSALKPGAGLISTLPARNAQLQEGSLLLIASGRPVFVLQGRVPAYRDMGPGMAGDDIRQLEQALARLGFNPGPADGHFDQQTAAALSRWYASHKLEPFGPTREQTLALATLERDAAEAERALVGATVAAAAARLSVDTARSAAEHAGTVASAELASRQADARRLRDDQNFSLALEAERARATHAERAAAAELQALLAERALIVLDPRQPATARAAIEAKLALARATQDKVYLEGQLAVQAVERETGQARSQVGVSESALRTAQLEGRKQVQLALDAQRLADADQRSGAERARRLAADLATLRSKLGVQLPLDEIVFVANLPIRVDEVPVLVGAPAVGPVLAVTDNQLVIDGSLTLDTAQLVKPGMPVAIDETDLGIKAKGTVLQVASTPGTRGLDGYHVYIEVRVTEAVGKLDGVSMRLSIPTESTQGPVLAVPTSALTLAADGSSRVQVQDGNSLRHVTVQPGLSTGGYVAIKAVNGNLQAGQLVVVGYKQAATKGSP